MRKAFIGVLVGFMATAVVAVPYTGPWNHEWDFESGQQGWTIYGGGSYYAAGGSGPNLAGTGPSNYGGKSLHLPDNSYARINIADFTSTQLGANGAVYTGKQGFIFQADAWLPNLVDDGSPLTPADFGGQPGNSLSSAGIGAEGVNIALYAEGKTDRLGVTARDYSWDNTGRNRSNSLNESNFKPDLNDWWDAMITFQIDYGYTTPGVWTAYAYIPFPNNYSATPGWVVMSNGNYPVHPDGSAATFLQLGGMYSWTQAQFDNAKLAYIPEPAALALLVLGLPMLRRRR